MIGNCNGNNSVVETSLETLDCSVNNNKQETARRKNSSKLELCKSLSSAESWESEDDCPPLASEDSDIGEQGEFESFSGTEEEEEDAGWTLSVTQK